jgi:hypothetical protein
MAMRRDPAIKEKSEAGLCLIRDASRAKIDDPFPESAPRSEGWRQSSYEFLSMAAENCRMRLTGTIAAGSA